MKYDKVEYTRLKAVFHKLDGIDYRLNKNKIDKVMLKELNKIKIFLSKFIKKYDEKMREE